MTNQKKRRFDRLRRFLFGIPWNEKTTSQKISGFVVHSIIWFILITPIFMVVFGLSPGDLESAKPILTPIIIAIFVGGAALTITFRIWEWIKKKSRKD